MWAETRVRPQVDLSALKIRRAWPKAVEHLACPLLLTRERERLGLIDPCVDTVPPGPETRQDGVEY